tara:strand:+ start:1209 stop:1649 length:441 start_codon:yes stop_codon:yes gene_type:complete
MEIVIRVVKTKAEYSSAMKVREIVFINEQQIDQSVESDGYDLNATHVIAESFGQTVGTGRIIKSADGEINTARLGRMAVLDTFRRKGIASLILRALESEAKKQGFKNITLHSQSYTKSLYSKEGYLERGKPFDEAGIEHVTMVKEL